MPELLDLYNASEHSKIDYTRKSIFSNSKLNKSSAQEHPSDITSKKTILEKYRRSEDIKKSMSVITDSVANFYFKKLKTSYKSVGVLTSFFAKLYNHIDTYTGRPTTISKENNIPYRIYTTDTNLLTSSILKRKVSGLGAINTPNINSKLTSDSGTPTSYVISDKILSRFLKLHIGKAVSKFNFVSKRASDSSPILGTADTYIKTSNVKVKLMGLESDKESIYTISPIYSAISNSELLNQFKLKTNGSAVQLFNPTNNSMLYTFKPRALGFVNFMDKSAQYAEGFTASVIHNFSYYRTRTGFTLGSGPYSAGITFNSFDYDSYRKRINDRGDLISNLGNTRFKPTEFATSTFNTSTPELGESNAFRNIDAMGFTKNIPSGVSQYINQSTGKVIGSTTSNITLRTASPKKYSGVKSSKLQSAMTTQTTNFFSDTYASGFTKFVTTKNSKFKYKSGETLGVVLPRTVGVIDSKYENKSTNFFDDKHAIGFVRNVTHLESLFVTDSDTKLGVGTNITRDKFESKKITPLGKTTSFKSTKSKMFSSIDTEKSWSNEIGFTTPDSNSNLKSILDKSGLQESKAFDTYNVNNSSLMAQMSAVEGKYYSSDIYSKFNLFSNAYNNEKINSNLGTVVGQDSKQTVYNMMRPSVVRDLTQKYTKVYINRTSPDYMSMQSYVDSQTTRIVDDPKEQSKLAIRAMQIGIATGVTILDSGVGNILDTTQSTLSYTGIGFQGIPGMLFNSSVLKWTNSELRSAVGSVLSVASNVTSALGITTPGSGGATGMASEILNKWLPSGKDYAKTLNVFTQAMLGLKYTKQYGFIDPLKDGGNNSYLERSVDANGVTNKSKTGYGSKLVGLYTHNRYAIGSKPSDIQSQIKPNSSKSSILFSNIKTDRAGNLWNNKLTAIAGIHKGKSPGSLVGNTDFVDFYFINYTQAKGNLFSPATKIIPFKALIKSNQANTSGNWSDVQYVGRPDKFFIYQGIDRTGTLEFTIMPERESESDKMWNKINYLASMCAPYDYQDGIGMLPNILYLKLGNYFNNYIIMNSVNVDTADAPWDLDNQLPMHATVSLDFKILFNKAPSTTNNTVFYGGKTINYAGMI